MVVSVGTHLDLNTAARERWVGLWADADGRINVNSGSKLSMYVDRVERASECAREKMNNRTHASERRGVCVCESVRVSLSKMEAERVGKNRGGRKERGFLRGALAACRSFLKHPCRILRSLICRGGDATALATC